MMRPFPQSEEIQVMIKTACVSHFIADYIFFIISLIMTLFSYDFGHCKSTLDTEGIDRQPYVQFGQTNGVQIANYRIMQRILRHFNNRTSTGYLQLLLAPGDPKGGQNRGHILAP